MRRLAAGVLLAGVGCLAGCADRAVAPADHGHPIEPAVATAEVTYDDHGDPEGLHRHHRWSDRIGQGAQPAGAVAFRNLAALGYKTVLSVDGARPDLENAAANGLTYVHVPIGYDGITADEAARIVKAVRDSDGPVYVHCHHGKHRGPAGVMVARIALEGVSHEQAVADMKASGTSDKYAGLYADVGAFELDEAALAACPAELPAYVAPAAMVDAMVHVDERFANLKAAKTAGWAVPPDSPDVSPPHEARMLWEHYRELARQDEAKGKGAEFVGLLGASEAASKQLEEALRASDVDAADTAFAAVKSGCADCHDGYRN